MDQLPLSVVRANVATVLTLQAFNRYSGFNAKFPKQGAGVVTHHGVALPTELHRLIASGDALPIVPWQRD